MERVCKNCQLFNQAESVCGVVVVHEGEKYELPVDPYDKCHWEQIDMEIQDELKDAIASAPSVYFKQRLMEQMDTPVEVKQVRMWSDGKDGFIETSADTDPASILWGDSPPVK